MVSHVVILVVSEGISLLCPPQSGCCAFVWGFEVPSPSWLIFPSIKWPPMVQIPFLFHSSLTAVPVLILPPPPAFLFLFFCPLVFYPVMCRVSCPFWRLRYLASIQYNHSSTCRFCFCFCFCFPMGEGEHHVLLLRHLDPTSLSTVKFLSMFQKKHLFP